MPRLLVRGALRAHGRPPAPERAEAARRGCSCCTGAAPGRFERWASATSRQTCSSVGFERWASSTSCQTCSSISTTGRFALCRSSFARRVAARPAAWQTQQEQDHAALSRATHSVLRVDVRKTCAMSKHIRNAFLRVVDFSCMFACVFPDVTPLTHTNSSVLFGLSTCDFLSF